MTFYWDRATPLPLQIVHCCFCAADTGLDSGKRPKFGIQSLKYLTSCSLQKQSANSYSKPSPSSVMLGVRHNESTKYTELELEFRRVKLFFLMLTHGHFFIAFRERNIDQLPSAHALTRNRTLKCSVYRTTLQPTETHQPGST